jgi:hypothetical protein
MSKDYSDYKNRALFVHIPKTAGASMSAAPFILKHGSQEIAPNSEFIKSLKFRFSFVRNPYDRFASVVLNLGFATPETFDDFVTKTFKKEYKKRIKENDFEWQPLWSMSKYLIFDGKLEVDFVGRFELLQEGWNKVCTLIGDDFKLPHHNKGKYDSYDKFYTPETRGIVGLAYADDFVNFKYQRTDKKGGETE